MPHRPRRLLAALLLSPALLLSACAQSPATNSRAPALAPDDVIRAAQQQLTDACLKRQGLKPPRPHAGPQKSPDPAQQRTADALFGTGRTELSIEIPTGYVVRAHTDGCLAAAQRTLYGDQRRWFRVSTIHNNLRPEAAHRDRSLASVRAEHREELADWRTLRTRALHRARAQLTTPSKTTDRNATDEQATDDHATDDHATDRNTTDRNATHHAGVHHDIAHHHKEKHA
ncbi:hypothetical protein [Streptomyces sp. NPDC055060]